MNKIYVKFTYIPETEKIHCEFEERYEYLALNKWFARRREGFQFDPRFKLKLWDGYTRGFDRESDQIDLGLWKEAVKMCQELGYPFQFTNKSEWPLNRDIKKSEAIEWMQEWIKGMGMSERDYQLRVASNILKDRYCNASVATSGGKTFIYSLFLFWCLTHGHKGKKFLLVVPSKTLVTQFYNDIIKYSAGRIDLNIQEIYGENPRITDPSREPDLVIATFQSLAGEKPVSKQDSKRPERTIKKIKKYPKEWFKQFWAVTGDEGHKQLSKSYQYIMKASKGYAYYRWGMSGSFPKEDSEEMMRIMQVTGPVCDQVKARELMDKGYITKVKIKGIIINWNDYEFAERLEIIAKQDKKVCYDLECAKIQESEQRIKIIKKIVTESNHNVLVLFHNTEYGQKLYQELSKDQTRIYHYIDGSISNKKRAPILTDMEQTSPNRILIASFGTLSTGVSIDSITGVIFTQSFKKEQIIIQSIGRALRLHKDKALAYIFDLVDRFNINPDRAKKEGKWQFKNVLFGHWVKRAKIYEDEEYPASTIEINL